MSRMARHYEPSNSKQPCEVCGLTDGNVLRGVFPNALPTDSYYGVVTFVHGEGECYQAMRNEIARLQAEVERLREEQARRVVNESSGGTKEPSVKSIDALCTAINDPLVVAARSEGRG